MADGNIDVGFRANMGGCGGGGGQGWMLSHIRMAENKCVFVFFLFLSLCCYIVYSGKMIFETYWPLELLLRPRWRLFLQTEKEK